MLDVIRPLSAAFVLAGLALSIPCKAAGKAPQSAHQFSAKVTKTVQMNYLLYLPPEYRETEKKWPLMLFLHGMGERGDDLEKVKKHGPPKLIKQGKDFPFIVLSPQCPRWSWWPVQVKALDALLDDICEQYRVDEDRIYVTGLSMGGYGTWALAEYRPQRFAAIAPICGGHQEPEQLKKIAHLPVWAFHGAQDPVVPVKSTKKIVRILEDAGGDPKMTIYPEAGHDSWKKAYSNPELYDWLLQHERKEEHGEN